jgi:hypothetical protein
MAIGKVTEKEYLIAEVELSTFVPLTYDEYMSEAEEFDADLDEARSQFHAYKMSLDWELVENYIQARLVFLRTRRLLRKAIEAQKGGNK